VKRLVTAGRRWASEHPRALVALELVVGVVFIVCIAWAVRGSFRAAGKDLRHADLAYFGLACAVLAVYYLSFVVGWIRLFSDWGIHLTYADALRAEMVSMLAKYVPGGVWTPAARVVAMRRSGVTDGALVTAAMAIEAGLSAVSGVMVFVISLSWVDGVHAPVVPIIGFALVVAVLVQPRIFRPMMGWVLRKLGYAQELPPVRPVTMALLLAYYALTWIVGGAALWLLLRSVHAHPEPQSIVYLGGVAAVGAIVAVLVVIAPSGLGVREGTMYGLMLAVAPKGAALGATLLNRVAITLVELLLLLVGGAILRARSAGGDDEAVALREQPE